MKQKKYVSDLIYSILGVAVLNGIIQLLLYPYLERTFGAEEFGIILSLLSIAAIMGSSFGAAANYSRMMSEKKRSATNGDYNIFLLGLAILSIPITLLSLIYVERLTTISFVLFFLLIVATIVRYYADVEFRLNTNYKRFFVYYIILSFGYIVGILLNRYLHSWYVIFIVGEFAAVLFVVFYGTVFKGALWKKSDNFQGNLKSIIILSFSYLISALILNADRLLLQFLEDGTAVTIFYTASIGGKIVSLASMPLNGVVIGYLNKYDGKVSKKQFGFVSIIGVVVCFAVSLFCLVFSQIFVKVMYPDIYEQAKAFFYIANLGQILYFGSSIYSVFLLRFTNEKYQLYISGIYLVIFLIVTIPFTYYIGLWGMAWSLIIVNATKFLFTILLGFRLLPTKAE